MTKGDESNVNESGGEEKSDSILPLVDKDQLESLGMGEEATAVLTCGADLAPGEQAFIDYGEAGWRSSWEMLYTYGFVPGSSPEEWMSTGGRPMFFDGVEVSSAPHHHPCARVD